MSEDNATEDLSDPPPMLIGFDWGTNTSCVKARAQGAKQRCSMILPTVVGYVKKDIIEDVLPNNRKVFFGNEALKERLHLDLIWPLKDGVINDVKAARDFAEYVRDALPMKESQESRAVIGMPANATEKSREDIRRAVGGVFSKVLLIPEPFLAALGCRDEERLQTTDYIDPVKNSLFVDIGAGTTDISLVQGYYPTERDMLSFPFAGDVVDELLDKAVRRGYPDSGISAVKIREIKERFSFVGDAPEDIVIKIIVKGKGRELNLANQVRESCEALLFKVFDGVKEMIERADSDGVEELLRNIILTGGGSQIRQFASRLTDLLRQDGYENPVVRQAGERYKDFVAIGALKAASQARDNQWQTLLL